MECCTNAVIRPETNAVLCDFFFGAWTGLKSVQGAALLHPQRLNDDCSARAITQVGSDLARSLMHASAARRPFRPDKPEGGFGT
jgi:hypothetical protein